MCNVLTVSALVLFFNYGDHLEGYIGEWKLLECRVKWV